METGVFFGLTEREYNAIPALRSTELRDFARDTPAHFAYRRTVETAESDALIEGRALHIAVLEPETFSHRVRVRRPLPSAAEAGCVTAKGEPSPGYLSREQKELKARLEAEIEAEVAGAEIILNPDQMECITEMSDALFQDREWRDLINRDSHAEVTVVWKDDETGLLCKARLDLWLPNEGIIVDLKGTKVVATPENFSREIRRYGYAHQMAFYRSGAEKAMGGLHKTSPVMLAAVEKSMPHLCAVRPMDLATLLIAQAENREHLARYAECKRTNVWPGHDPCVPWSLPGYADAQELGITFGEEAEGSL